MSRWKQGTISALCILSCFGLISCEKPTGQNRQQQYKEFLQKIDKRELSYLDILYSTWQADVEAPQTVELLQKFQQYKIRVNLTFTRVDELKKALASLNLDKPIKHFEKKDEFSHEFRMGCIFYDQKMRKVFDLYFLSNDPEVRIGDEMYQAPQELFNAVTYYLPLKEQEICKSRISSWFPKPLSNNDPNLPTANP